MDRPYFHVSFRPNGKLISTVRKFTEEFYLRMLDDVELSEKVALATHELLENAVAYSSDGETGVRVEVEDEHVSVRTWNRTSPERIANLRAMIAELEGAPDADAHYQAMMRRTAHRTDGSGLGLARIRAEADMTISYEIEDQRVCIQARTKIKAKEVSR